MRRRRRRKRRVASCCLSNHGLQATRLKPDFGTAYYNLALGYLALGDREAALVQYNILKAIDADLAEKLFSLINP